jgi:hypothetical protein
MPPQSDEPDSRLKAELTAEELRGGVVHVADAPVAAGTRLAFPRLSIDAPWEALLAFVDRDPAANWSHSCRYVLVSRHTGAVASFEAQFSPFGSDQNRGWHVVYKDAIVSDSVQPILRSR